MDPSRKDSDWKTARAIDSRTGVTILIRYDAGALKVEVEKLNWNIETKR
jgi:hypothetical protein